MSTSVAWVPPVAEPLDEGKWQTWLAKGRASEQRSNHLCIMAVKGLSIATLLVQAGLWSQLAPYEILVRFIVCLGALAVMLQALQARYYIAAAAFGALLLLYNPVVPAVSFSGGWPRAIVAASIVPFAASLFWRNVRSKQNA